jgi:hypothetical protein
MDQRVLAACCLQGDPGVLDPARVGPNQIVTVGPIQMTTLTPSTFCVPPLVVDARGNCGGLKGSLRSTRILSRDSEWMCVLGDGFFVPAQMD